MKHLLQIPALLHKGFYKLSSRCSSKNTRYRQLAMMMCAELRCVNLERRTFIMLSFCLPAAYSFAGEETNLNQLTAECIRAAKNYRPIQKDFYYKVLHSVECTGWIGEPDNVELKHPIAMTVRYAGSLKEGHYRLLHSPQKKYGFTVKSDMQGNIKLIPKDKDRINYEFQGIIRQGTILGLWANAKLNKSFALYVYPIKQTDP